jgi:hypothetical protein
VRFQTRVVSEYVLPHPLSIVQSRTLQVHAGMVKLDHAAV